MSNPSSTREGTSNPSSTRERMSNPSSTRAGMSNPSRTREGMSEADHLEYCRFLDGKLCSIAKRRAALDVEEANWLREAESMKLWRVFGHASLLEYMERAMGYQPHTARERLRVARALEHLPQLEDALAKGRVCHSVVREVAGVVTAETEGDWLDRIEGLSCREVEQLAAGHKPGDRPDDPTDPDLHTRKLELVLGPEAYAV